MATWAEINGNLIFLYEKIWYNEKKRRKGAMFTAETKILYRTKARAGSDDGSAEVKAGQIFNFDALRKVGFFDENTFLYYEEDILFTKLHKLGYLSCVLNNEFYIHNHPIIKKKKTNIFILKETYKSLYYYLCKYRNINLIHKIRFHLLSKITIFEFLILNLFRRN